MCDILYGQRFAGRRSDAMRAAAVEIPHMRLRLRTATRAGELRIEHAAVAAGPKPLEIQRGAFGKQGAERGQQAAQTALAIVAGNRPMRPIRQDLAHHAGMRALRARPTEKPARQPRTSPRFRGRIRPGGRAARPTGSRIPSGSAG